MTIKDKTITCKDCGRTFIFRADEQSFYEEKGYDEPIRCRECRSARKNSAGPAKGPRPAAGSSNFRSNGGSSNSSRTGERELFSVTCASCGANTKVPFKPVSGRPVYCRDCFSKQR